MATAKVGLLVGREWSWPPRFLEEVNSRNTDVGMKAATQPMRSAPTSRKSTPIRIARVDVNVSKLAVPGIAMAAHRQGGYQPGCGVRPDDEHARSAERRVRNQWRDDRVESHDGWHADDAGIGHRLGYHDRPDGEPGEEIRQQAVPPVCGKPPEDGQQPCRARDGVRWLGDPQLSSFRLPGTSAGPHPTIPDHGTARAS